MPNDIEPATDKIATDLYASVLHEDMQEIISRPPGWLVRSGMLVILLVVGSILMLSYLVHYPERLVVPAQLLSATPPVTVSARVPGRLAQVLVHDRQRVTKGQVLGYLQTTAAPEQVQRLYAQLVALRAQVGQWPAGGASLPSTLEYDQLGELESSFVAFKRVQAAYMPRVAHRPVQQRLPLAVEEDVYLQALDLLRQEIAAWLHNNALLASVSGQANLASSLSTGQEVQAHQPLFYLIPTQKPASLYGEILVTQAQAATLQTGQPVAIRLAGYQASGVVLGQMGAILEMPTAEGMLRARIYLPTGLQTTSHRVLPYRAGIQASAEVTIRNPRLVTRVISFVDK